MQLIENFSRLLSRFRYPVSMPEDVAGDLGLHLSNSLSFDAFIEQLSSPQITPKTLRRWMPRFKAESVFKSAIRQEIFKSSSLFSYKFIQGWVVVALYFNDDGLLTRLYLLSPTCEINFPLEEETYPSPIAISSLQASR